MFLLDYIRQRWVRKGAVVEAGIPPESRPDAIPVDRTLVARHLAAFPELPQDEAVVEKLVEAVSDPMFIQTGPRALTEQLIASGRLAADAEPLNRLLQVLTNEITRRMYIDAARLKEGAIGIRLFAEPGRDEPAIRQLVEQDLYGLGPGVYPFDLVPDNPTPGRRCGFYIRVATPEPTASR